jgi:hypothetical protein
LEALDGAGGYQFLLRLHRSGVFAYHHAVRDAGGYPGHAVSLQLECLAMLDALDLAGGLYGPTSYHSLGPIPVGPPRGVRRAPS